MSQAIAWTDQKYKEAGFRIGKMIAEEILEDSSLERKWYGMLPQDVEGLGVTQGSPAWLAIDAYAEEAFNAAIASQENPKTQSAPKLELALPEEDDEPETSAPNATPNSQELDSCSEIVQDFAKYFMSSCRTKIFLAVVAHPQGITWPGIAAFTGMPESSVIQSMKKCRKSGLIRLEYVPGAQERGMYFLTEKGMKAASVLGSIVRNNLTTGLLLRQYETA